jgi:hypothetical protein
MSTTVGIRTHRIDPRKRRVPLFSSRTTAPWDTGESPVERYVPQRSRRVTRRIQVLCDYERIQPMDNYIVQEYLHAPYLIDGYKFGRCFPRVVS